MEALFALAPQHVNKIKHGLLTIMAFLLMSIYCPSWAEVTIEKLTEDVLVFDQGENRGLLIMGNKGIAVIAPLNQQVAIELNRFIAKNYKQSITHVVYTHSHWDRITGEQCLKNREQNLLQTKNAGYFCLAIKTQMLLNPMYISIRPMLLNWATRP